MSILSSDTVEFANGERERLSDLRHRVPHSRFMDTVHLDVCERLAEARPPPEDLRAVYLNVLFTKSERAKEITALHALARAGAAPVRWNSPLATTRLGALLGGAVELDTAGSQPPLVDFRVATRFALKVAAHRAFRLLHRRRPAKRIVRAWVDTTDSLYGGLRTDATFFIYPFSGRLTRQLRYLALCLADGRDATLAGLPYRTRDALAVLFAGRDRAERLAAAEAAAFRAHARELLATGVREVFTSDEFEVGAVVMHEALSREDVATTNSTHGVAIYGPYVHYGHLTVHTQAQRAFYSSRGQWRTCELRSGAPDPGAPIDGTALPPRVVWLQGNWRRAVKPWEVEAADAALRSLASACRDLGVDWAIKAHPNVPTWRRAYTARRHRAVVVDQLADLPPARPIFVNLLSTAYFDLLRAGPTLFLADPLVQPESVFGPGIPTCRPEELKQAIARWLEPEGWGRALVAQITREQRPAAQVV